MATNDHDLGYRFYERRVIGSLSTFKLMGLKNMLKLEHLRRLNTPQIRSRYRLFRYTGLRLDLF